MEKIDAQRVYGYALYKDGRNTKLSYPLEEFDSDVSGRSFHNGRFIQRMREKAAFFPKCFFLFTSNFCLHLTIFVYKMFNYYGFLKCIFLKLLYCNPSFRSCYIQHFCSVKLEQGTVTSLIEENGVVKGVHYKTKDGQEMTARAPLTIVCDGCFSNLRRSLCEAMVNKPGFFPSYRLLMLIFQAQMQNLKMGRSP